MSEFWRDFLFWALGVWVGVFAGRIWGHRIVRASIARLQAQLDVLQSRIVTHNTKVAEWEQLKRDWDKEVEKWRNP